MLFFIVSTEYSTHLNFNSFLCIFHIFLNSHCHLLYQFYKEQYCQSINLDFLLLIYYGVIINHGDYFLLLDEPYIMYLIPG